MPLPIAERDGHGGIMSYNLCGVKPFGRLVDYGKGQEVICRLSVYSLANKLCLEQVIRIHFKDNYRKSSCVQTDGLSLQDGGLDKGQQADNKTSFSVPAAERECILR